MTRRLLLTIVFLFSLAPPLFALDPFEWNPKPADPRAYAPVRQAHQPSLAAWDYPTVFRKLQADLETAPQWNKTEPAYQRLLQALRVLNERFSHFESDLARADKNGETLDAFLDRTPTGLFQFPCPDGVCFSGTAYALTYDEIGALPDPQAEDLLYRIDTVNRLLTDFKKPAIAQTTRAIENAKTRWEIYMREGMSQFPWEAAFNSWTIGADNIQYPPMRQWILAHPELGVEVSTKSLKEITAKQSLSIELIGQVWYRWKRLDHPESGLGWWGISAAASLRDDLRPGIGLIAHYGRFVTLGVLWHDVNRDGRWFNDPPFITMGIDLFRFAGDRAPAYQKKWERALEVRERFLQ
ncbi:MAG: hypothetical protein HY282_16250 [Nitrospirae bacterium]|nr:hypothetical protein [Candidatus Manganitrophaceae bacterium]